MNNHLSTKQFTSQALRNLSALAHEKKVFVAVGQILRCWDDDRDKPLLVSDNASNIFYCGGLSDIQFQQLPALKPDLVGRRVVFTYEMSAEGVRVNVQFKTLLLNNDSRPAALRLASVLNTLKGAVQ